LRVTAQRSWFYLFKRFQSLLDPNGMIAFDYGAEIDEAEAKQIILALKEGLQQQNAG
jgi:hypothetical protein